MGSEMEWLSKHILNRAVFRMSSEHPHQMLIHLSSVLHSSQPGKRRDAVSGIVTALKEDHSLSILVSEACCGIQTIPRLC
ncbi:hypothetical protein BLNAU_8041 [Blattamonas nauphoetae]|uniref:Uncharacterized protein n=1 Tax=Blattamonas nauphoetae TaxID=2049346 RepID=A0ABQ9XZQ9_9EUKA|nr:hypothetical protein BLNAU_8041 [Blattamonas nauphoetae]